MSHTQEDTQHGRDGARTIATQPKDRGRRWYHLRPEPRRRTDVMGLNTTWWAVFWFIVIVALVEPWWWW